MYNRAIFMMCVISVAFFSCRKTMEVEQQIVAPTAAAQSVRYEESNILRVPGNYQEWNVPVAPKLVSVNGDGAYDGYIDFTLANTEFWLVKGTSWDNVTTFNETGNYTFGHNGNFFTVPSGAGIYRVTANTNTFKWSCEKINTFSISGTAVGGNDAAMICNPSALSWRITQNLNSGDFVFRANKSDSIVFGHNIETSAGALDYNGAKISIAYPGNYTIVISLQHAGNYVYSITKTN